VRPLGAGGSAHDLPTGGPDPSLRCAAVIPLSDERVGTRPAVVTMLLIAACVVVYLFVQPTPLRETSDDLQFDYDHAGIPYELTHGRPLTNCQVAQAAAPSQAAQACRLPTGNLAFAPGKPVYLGVLYSLFLHGSILHIAGNMLFLWVFGRRVEDRLGPIGFAVLYLCSGIVAAAAHVLAGPSSTVPFIGASGAIAGVMGAYLVWFPNARINTLFFVFLIFWFRIPAWMVLIAWFVLQFFTSPNSGVAWVAHVGGFVFGAGVAWLIRPRRSPPTPPRPYVWPPPSV
jgi:membrane associated rhomboid family serine protease